MKITSLLPLLSAVLSLTSFGGEIIPGIVAYDPPVFFYGFKPANDPGDDPFGMEARAIEYLARDNKATRFRQLNVGLRMVGVTVGEGKRLSYAPVSGADIKKLMADALTARATNSPKVEETQIAGRRAFKVHCVVPMPDYRKDAVFLFDHVWVPISANKVLTLKLVGSDQTLLKSVQDSLSALELSPNAGKEPSPQERPLPVAKDAAHLGDERKQVVEACGKPAVQHPSSDVFLAGEYVVTAGYQMPLVTSITYVRVSDKRKFLEGYEEHSRELDSLVLPLQKGEIAELLSRHSTGSAEGKMSWKTTEENRWERSDGALAGYYPIRKLLIVSTKETWPKIGVLQK